MRGFSPTYLVRYRKKRCRCRMSDIADKKAKVGAHLCISIYLHTYIHTHINTHRRTRRTELTENVNFRSFAAKGKRKTEVCFPWWANNKCYSTSAVVSANMLMFDKSSHRIHGSLANEWLPEIPKKTLNKKGQNVVFIAW
jgi:hypothetical protein